MATGQRSTPSFFNFLKEGLLLPAQNRRLFAAVFAIIIASTSLLLLGHFLAVEPLVDEISIDTKALNSTDPGSPDFIHLIQEIQVDTRDLLITSAVYLLVALIIGSVIRIIVLFAAVATYSGELHTFASLLGKAKAQLKGPILTLAFVYALEIAYLALVVVMAGLLAFLMIKQYFALLFACALLIIIVSIFVVYFSFICSLSIVVAVAEPGCHGAGAVGRAWRLMKGKLLRAVLFIFVTVVLAAAFTPFYTLAKTCALSNMTSGLLLGLLYTILMAAVQVFAACAMTALYYECKGSTEASATEYIKVSTKEQINV
ncbi:hypothetical protein PAHAL_5G293000 [Panicum hallii]|jgi:hypothetical protein|uniref:Glycerophosphoryl diester phosphodiesterase membrane domain-containing protein n=1 Tax=Panicum hallii TaxID=206008 RepID=A0A2S3HV70_9POAL|nr:uncharacterized protein LOC112894064 [Panicum hallii]PAN30552.1 hypothetical protein PAHAL_5G293000 [Panicum hallii]